MSEISDFIQEVSQSSLAPSACEDNEKSAVYEPGRGLHQILNLQVPDVKLPSHQNCEKKELYCL